MTYNSDYTKNLVYLKAILGEKLSAFGVIYNGDVEKPSGDIGIYNYRKFIGE